MRCGKAAAGDVLLRAARPRDGDVLSASFKLNEISRAAANRFRIVGPGKVYRDDSGKMSGPFALRKILVVARRDDVPAAQIGFVNPVFVKQNVVLAPATEAAIQNVIAALQ